LRFAIVGAGAIGSLFGARLSLAGNDVILTHRNRSIVRTIQKNGVSLRELDGTVSRVRVPVRKGPTELAGTDVLIVAVKAYDTTEVAESYRRLVPLETTILSLQNGLGNAETLQSKLRNEVLAGSTTEGALLLSPGSVRHTGTGSTIIGALQPGDSGNSSRIKIAFNRAGFPTKTSSNIGGVLWAKAIVNAAINPLSALTRLPNGVLVKNAAIQEIALRVIDEGILVSRAARIRLVGNPRKLWRRILLSTKTNESSMLQDIERGKMTEIRQLNGAILSHGKKTRIKTPVNGILTKLVLALEESLQTTTPRVLRGVDRTKHSVSTGGSRLTRFQGGIAYPNCFYRVLPRRDRVQVVTDRLHEVLKFQP
jgi:2-dehydropantoate 2-reductase